MRRATLARIPAPSIVITSDDPPADRNGSVMPDTGSSADDRAEVDRGLADDPRGHTGGEQHAEPVGRAPRDAEPDEAEPGEQREHEQAPDQAELLADDREDEVGVRVRQEQPLRAARRRGRRRSRRRCRSRSATAQIW